MTEKVTIIVPIYNVEKYVSKCLNSLINQTYDNIKILAIDDGSPDASKDIVKQYCKKDHRVKLIEKENGGYGSALEIGIAKTISKYFIICDPDDWLDKNAIKVLISKAEKDDLDIVVGNKFNVYEGEKKLEYQKTFENSLNVRPYIVYTKIEDIQKFSLGLVSPHAKLYKTELAKNIKLPHHVSYTDFVLYILSLVHTKKIEYIDKPLAYYLINRKGNTATSISPTIINDYLIGWQSVYKQLPDNVNVDVLLYRLLLQLKFVISEDARVNKKFKYYNEIYKCLNELMNYKDKILLVNSAYGNVKSKIINKILLSKHYSRVAVKMLIIKDKI